METEKASVLHNEHQVWLNKILYYSAEVDSLQGRLDNIASQITNKDILVQVEHFNNQFIMRREQLEEMRHAIKDHQNYINNKASQNGHGTLILGDHAIERTNIETFEGAFDSMRVEFINFWASALVG